MGKVGQNPYAAILNSEQFSKRESQSVEVTGADITQRPAEKSPAFPDENACNPARERGKAWGMKAKTEAKTEDGTKPLKNARRELFAHLCVKGVSQTDAYKELFPRSKKWKPESVHEKASKMAAKARPRISFLKSRAATKAVATLEECCAVLTEMIRAKHSDFLTMSADGVWFHDIGTETLNQAALKKVKTRITTERGSGETISEKQFDEIELESKVTAIAGLADLLSWKKTKVELSGGVRLSFDRDAAKALGIGVEMDNAARK